MEGDLERLFPPIQLRLDVFRPICPSRQVLSKVSGRRLPARYGTGMTEW
jgi:hypothetical protein